MKKIGILSLTLLTLLCVQVVEGEAQNRSIDTLAERYIDFLNTFETKSEDVLHEEVEELFAPNLKKITNGHCIYNQRSQLISQWRDCLKQYGKASAVLLESFVSSDGKRVVLYFEITFSYCDKPDEVIAIFKCNSDGLIEENNQVYGEKASYQWQGQC